MGKQLQRPSWTSAEHPSPLNDPKEKEPQFTCSPVQKASRNQWTNLPNWVHQWNGHTPHRWGSTRLLCPKVSAKQPKTRTGMGKAEKVTSEKEEEGNAHSRGYTQMKFLKARACSSSHWRKLSLTVHQGHWGWEEGTKFQEPLRIM